MTCYTNKVFQITDLVRLIAYYKHLFEDAYDIDCLNNNYQFEHLIYHIFYDKYDSGLIVRNKDIDDRLSIQICKHDKTKILITFEAYEKYKRTFYYSTQLLLDRQKQTALFNQREIAWFILNDNILLPFFMTE